MTGEFGDLPALLDATEAVALLRVAAVSGSAPRDPGAQMLVSATAMAGSIGGGQLEYMAIDEARKMLAQDREEAVLNLPLGPEIGQCCGGRVEIRISRLDAAARQRLIRAHLRARAAAPRVLIFGAGHVGRALAAAMAPLPAQVSVVDSRLGELARCTDAVAHCLSPLPEAEIRAAPAGSAFVIVTHDHALDFLLAAEALGRGDAAYVGMIGSATKRQKFLRFLSGMKGAPAANRLVCPIGAQGRGDKRPEVIAAFVAAEIMAAIAAAAAPADVPDHDRADATRQPRRRDRHTSEGLAE